VGGVGGVGGGEGGEGGGTMGQLSGSMSVGSLGAVLALLLAQRRAFPWELGHGVAEQYGVPAAMLLSGKRWPKMGTCPAATGCGALKVHMCGSSGGHTAI
jgi:hypothetical protein